MKKLSLTRETPPKSCQLYTLMVIIHEKICIKTHIFDIKTNNILSTIYMRYNIKFINIILFKKFIK